MCLVLVSERSVSRSLRIFSSHPSSEPRETICKILQLFSGAEKSATLVVSPQGIDHAKFIKRISRKFAA
jgi:hypothetical protein